MSHVNSHARVAADTFAHHSQPSSSASRRRRIPHASQAAQAAGPWINPLRQTMSCPNEQDGPGNTRMITHPDGSLYYRMSATFDDLGLELLLKDADPEVLADLRDRLFHLLQNRRVRGKLEQLRLAQPIRFVPAPDGTFILCPTEIGDCFVWNEKRRMMKPLGRAIFWQCIIDFPDQHFTIPARVEDEFVGALAHGVNSHLHLNDHSGTQTPFPLTLDQIQRINEVYSDLRLQLSQGHKHVVPILYWHIARVMLIIEESRRAAGYGTFESRMYRDSAVPSTTSSVRMLDTAISLFLLGAHGRYRKSLRTINLNDFVSLEEFTTLMRSLLAEWADTNLLGSVFLSANVAFQTIEGVNQFQRVASLTSAVFSILSVASGIHHVWFHRYYLRADIDDATEYLSRGNFSTTKSDFHMTLTSYFLALPLSMMLWAVSAFTVAISSFSIQFTRADPESNVMMIVIVALAVGVVLLLGCYFWRLWKEPRTMDRDEEVKIPVYAPGESPN